MEKKCKLLPINRGNPENAEDREKCIAYLIFRWLSDREGEPLAENIIIQ